MLRKQLKYDLDLEFTFSVVLDLAVSACCAPGQSSSEHSDTEDEDMDEDDIPVPGSLHKPSAQLPHGKTPLLRLMQHLTVPGVSLQNLSRSKSTSAVATASSDESDDGRVSHHNKTMSRINEQMLQEQLQGRQEQEQEESHETEDSEEDSEDDDDEEEEDYDDDSDVLVSDDEDEQLLRASHLRSHVVRLAAVFHRRSKRVILHLLMDT